MGRTIGLILGIIAIAGLLVWGFVFDGFGFEDTAVPAAASPTNVPNGMTVNGDVTINGNIIKSGGSTSDSDNTNVARYGRSYLGTVSHHTGLVTVPANGYLVIVGDITQSGGQTYRVYSPNTELDEFNGVPGDVQLWLVNGNDKSNQDKQLRLFMSELDEQGYDKVN